MTRNPHRKINVVFICTGNLCRSPMAEAVFAHLVEQAGLSDRFEIASAGTGHWHVGESPHPKTLDALRRHGIPPIAGKRAQLIDTHLLARADYLIAMEQEHVDELREFAGQVDGKVSRLLDHAPNAPVRDVPDPYYNGRYEEVYRLVQIGARGLLDHLRAVEGL